MREHRLFRRNGNPTFLALIWTAKGNSDLPWSVLELYKVRVISERNVRLKFVRGLKKLYVSIKEISGQDIAGDGVPHLILDYSSGGLWYALSGIRIYRLERNSVDVTPDWAGRAEYFLSLGTEKVPALIVSDDRWGGFFHGCSQCGPLFQVVMRWSPKGFAPVCRNHPEYYEKRIESWKRSRARWEKDWEKDPSGYPKVDPYLVVLETIIATSFNLLQMGRWEEGRTQYQVAMNEAFGRGAKGWGISEKDFLFWKDAVEKNFSPAVDAVASFPDIGCPLMAYRGSGVPIGLIKRARSFLQ